MLEELAGDILIGPIVGSKLDRNSQHGETIHAHPGGAIRLLEKSSGGKRLAAIEHSDIVQAQESAFEDVIAPGVLAIHPPGKIHEQLVEDCLQEPVIRFSC